MQSFYLERIRPGGLLGARVPFVPQAGDQVVIALELPDGIVFALDGVVRELGETVSGKTPIMLRLVGFDSVVVGRLEQMVREGKREAIRAERIGTSGARPKRRSAQPPPPTPEDAPIDIALEPAPPPDTSGLLGSARHRFDEISAELIRLRELGAREILGVDEAASLAEIRLAYFALVRKYHPDTAARFREPAVTFAASELSIFINRAYDRVRSAVRATGAPAIAGPAIRPELGWLIDIGDLVPATVPTKPAAPRRPGRPNFRVRLQAQPEDAPTNAAVANAAPISVPSPRKRRAPLTADDLFSGLSDETSDGAAKMTQLKGDDGETTSLSELIADAAQASERGDLEKAAETYAEALQIDPRDRKLRARYHSTRGRQLLAAGDRVRATTQLELALTHDPDCREARDALDGLASGSQKRRGLRGWFSR